MSIKYTAMIQIEVEDLQEENSFLKTRFGFFSQSEKNNKNICNSRLLLQFEECRFELMYLPLMRLYNMVPWVWFDWSFIRKHAKNYVNIWLPNIIVAMQISTTVCVALRWKECGVVLMLQKLLGSSGRRAGSTVFASSITNPTDI